MTRNRRHRTATPNVTVEQAAVSHYCSDHDRRYPYGEDCPDCGADGGGGGDKGGER